MLHSLLHTQSFTVITEIGYAVLYINACPQTQTHTGAYHNLSYPGIRNVSRFLAFLLLEKIIDSSYCVISAQLEK